MPARPPNLAAQKLAELPGLGLILQIMLGLGPNQGKLFTALAGSRLLSQLVGSRNVGVALKIEDLLRMARRHAYSAEHARAYVKPMLKAEQERMAQELSRVLGSVPGLDPRAAWTLQAILQTAGKTPRQLRRALRGPMPKPPTRKGL